NLQINVAQTYFWDFRSLTDGEKAKELQAYHNAHLAYAAAMQAQEELDWLETDEQGKSQIIGGSDALKVMYSRNAWCLVQLGDLKGAVVSLEAGRARAMKEVQNITSAQYFDVCDEHRMNFVRMRNNLIASRSQGDRGSIRIARDAFLEARESIR